MCVAWCDLVVMCVSSRDVYDVCISTRWWCALSSRLFCSRFNQYRRKCHDDKEETNCNHWARIESVCCSESSWDSVILMIRSSVSVTIPVVTNWRISSAVRKVFMVVVWWWWWGDRSPLYCIRSPTVWDPCRTSWRRTQRSPLLLGCQVHPWRRLGIRSSAVPTQSGGFEDQKRVRRFSSVVGCELR